MELATSDYVWIAEADDYAHPRFLQEIFPRASEKNVVIAYAGSKPVRIDGSEVWPNYKPYLDDVSSDHWNESFTAPGRLEAENYLIRKNTIPNASAVIVHRASALEALEGLTEFRLSGDWLFYVKMAVRGDISFCARILNFHRRHAGTATEAAERSFTWLSERLAVHVELLKLLSVPTSLKCEAICRTIHAYLARRRRHKEAQLPRFNEHPEVGRLKALFHQLILQPELIRSKRRILMVLPDGDFGGGQVNCVRLANALAENDLVFLVNARSNEVDPDLVSLISPQIVLLEGSIGSSGWYSTQGMSQKSQARFRTETLRELIEFFEVSHAFSQVWWADKFCLSLVSGTNIVWTLRMCGCYETLFRNLSTDPEFTSLVPEIMSRVDALSYVADKNLEIFQVMETSKPKIVEKIYNGLSLKGLDRQTSALVSKRQSELLVVLCSRAIPSKGWLEAIKATMDVNGREADNRSEKCVRLVLIGDGPAAANLRSEYGEREDILFLGRQKNPIEVMNMCDVGLLPSRFVGESLPTVIIEYMACGLPVVACDIGSVREMIESDGLVAGAVLHAHEEADLVAELSGHISTYLHQRDLLTRDGILARRIFEEKFDIVTTRSAYLSIFDRAGEGRFLEEEVLAISD